MSETETYTVRVEKQTMVFSAAHFVTFGDNLCERIHGHNYGVWAEVTGELDANQFVIDFIQLRDALQTLVGELDHRVLLPTRHPTIRVSERDGEVVATFAERRWVFPADDCVLLPVANTTAELLASYLGRRLQAALPEALGAARALRLAVDENRGQWGIWEWTR